MALGCHCPVPLVCECPWPIPFTAPFSPPLQHSKALAIHIIAKLKLCEIPESYAQQCHNNGRQLWAFLNEERHEYLRQISVR